jgi:site-specific recombinase XerD
MQNTAFFPLFDTLENFVEDQTQNNIRGYLQKINLCNIEQEYLLISRFLKSYSGSYDTYNSYRRETERFLHWSWNQQKKLIKELKRDDLEDYFAFCQNPPKEWIATQNFARFIEKEGQRIPNPNWRPFVVRITKAEHKKGKSAEISEYNLSKKSLASLIAILSTFFTYLQQEGYLEINPVQLIRQKSRYLQKEQSHRVTRKLSKLQWQYLIETVEQKANLDPQYERHLFLMTIFYLLGLRISEVADNLRHTPVMKDFAPDSEGRWWFTTVGKGNKVRDIAVPDQMLLALKRYRLHLGLNQLPTRSDNMPLITKEKGRGNLGTRQVRNLVETCFNFAVEKLKSAQKINDALDLEAATVHWLRHTAISADVEHRPREHVRDDAGHESSVVTDRYIDIDRRARHDSAKFKQLKPFLNSEE